MTGLKVFRSNRIESLVDTLAARVQASPPTDPLSPIEIVVGSRGMERWLRHKLAERIGVCANIAFPFPTSCFDGIVDCILGTDAASCDGWQPDALAWALLEVLPKTVDLPGFEAVHAYVDSWQGPVAAKPYGLACQIAAVTSRRSRPTSGVA